MIVLQPVMTICFFPPAFVVLSRIVPPSSRNLSVSLAVFFAYLMGAGSLPVLLGAFGDAGNFNLAFVLVGGFIMASAGLVLPLDAKGRAASPERTRA
jgi:NNP family nitrate/nitrite transporter-like MFS transporter